MSDLPPEAAAEREPATPDLPPAEAEGVGLEVPEADALEQAQEAGGRVGAGPPRALPPDVPEADALEQAIEVVDDDDYDR